jgi:hypothetical protein
MNSLPQGKEYSIRSIVTAGDRSYYVRYEKGRDIVDACHLDRSKHDAIHRAWQKSDGLNHLAIGTTRTGSECYVAVSEDNMIASNLSSKFERDVNGYLDKGGKLSHINKMALGKGEAYLFQVKNGERFFGGLPDRLRRILRTREHVKIEVSLLRYIMIEVTLRY